MIMKVKLKSAPEEASTEVLIVAFLQICISKAVLWPPVLICVRSLMSGIIV